MTEVNVQIYKSEDEDVIEKMIFEDYNYEIKIERWQKILVFILNILTGGLGTLILPFINKNRNYTVLIFAGIILGFFQLFHFLHFFSVLSGVKFVEDIYDSISNDQILETLFKDDLKNKNDDSIIGTLLELRKFDITDTIPQIERKKFLKYSLGLLSGMSYANSFFTTLVNFMQEDPMKKNLKLSIKILLYSFLNPGGGIILSFLSLFPNIKKENNIRGIILSILGIIVGIILLVSPFSLIIGLFLSKLCNKMITLLPLKILFIFLGIFGMFISFITSFINKNTILDANMKKINPFDIIYRTKNEINVLYSKFGIVSSIRFILNMIIPRVGTFTLLCRYGCNAGIVKVSFVQFNLGFICLISGILLIFQIDFKNWNFLGATYTNIMAIVSNFTDNGLLILNFLFTVSLCFYFSGLVLIILCDYLEDIDFPDKKISGLIFIFLNILTGGLGISLFNYKFYIGFYNLLDRKEESTTFKCLFSYILYKILEIGSYICFVGTIYIIFFFNEVSKSSKLAFPICYVGENLITIIYYILFDYKLSVLSSPPKKKKFNKIILNYEIIENNNIELY